MASLIVRADQGGEQEHIPCHTHALTALRQAQKHGLEWIRVEKPGHVCQFMVAALVAQMKADPRRVPYCLVNVSPREQAQRGASYETRRQLWPGRDPSPTRPSLQAAGGRS